jgi:membrane-bound lytic murein transglycosylase D
LLNKYSLLLAAVVCFGACSGTKPHDSASSSKPSDTALAVARSPVLVPDEQMLFSEVSEYVNLGLESISDSLWFQAGEDFDSALVRLAGLEATDSLSPNVYTMVQVLRDSVQKLLISTVAMTSQMSEPVPLTQLFDEEMEEVTDSSVHALDSITHKIDPKDYDLPLTSPLDQRILQAMSVFMGPGKGYFTKWLNRKSRYEAIIVDKLAAAGMPKDLMYLAMVESGFNPKAWSKASASGMWQFISGTGRRYGLHDDWWYDPRRDPLMATDAALEYLGDLYDEFGDWHQAMAGYNCGEGRIRRHRKQDSTLTYWAMPLPQETRNYVPKILAAMIIGHNPGRYGFHLDNPSAPLLFDTVTVHDCLTIGTIAKAAGVSEDTIVSLNPALRRWCTPPNRSEYMVHVPTGTRDLFVKNYELLDKTQIVNWHHHVVGKGDNLASIASRYRVSVASIKATNKIKGNKIHRGQSLLIPLAPIDALKYAEVDQPDAPSRGGKFRAGTYKVRNGDNLFDIARKFNTTVSQLLAANKLRPGSTIRPGQKLKLGGKASVQGDDEPEVHQAPDIDVKVPTASRQPSATGTKNKTGQFQVYKVATNDNIFSISMKLKISEDNLRKWNGIRGNRIMVGQKLKYLGTAPAPEAELEARATSEADSEDAADIAVDGPASTKGNSSSKSSTVATTSIEFPSASSLKKQPTSLVAPSGSTKAGKTHLVKPGENLYQIAREYATDFKTLIELNKLGEDAQIFPGQTLLVSGNSDSDSVPSKTVVRPEKAEEKQYYVVKAGDSLWDISVKYRTTVQKIKDLNGRLSPVLKSGTRIRVK